MIVDKVTLKSVIHDRSTGLHVTNENTIQGYDVLYFDKVTVHAYGTKDVYYFNMSNGNMYVWRSKLDRIVRGCMFVRNREEYDIVYAWIQYQGFANMPENIFDRLDREWKESH
jgi:hypothetical protein